MDKLPHGYHHRRKYKGALPLFMSAIVKNNKKPIREFISELILALKPIILGKKYHIGGYVSATMGRLRDRGYVEIETRDGEQYYVLTAVGKEYFTSLSLPDYKIKSGSWDGSWRLIIFDIKESSRYLRDRLRRELSARGFIKIQNSVWVYPYDCEAYVGLLKTSFRLGREVLYVVADKIENDSWIKKAFDLK